MGRIVKRTEPSPELGRRDGRTWHGTGMCHLDMLPARDESPLLNTHRVLSPTHFLLSVLVVLWLHSQYSVRAALLVLCLYVDIAGGHMIAH